MLDPREIKAWDQNGLENWLADPTNVEDDTLDFKERYEGRVTAEEVCIWMTSFANSIGGYLIFGVSDSRQLVGVDEDDITTILNQKLRDNVDPLISFNLIHSIEIQGTTPKKLIRVVKIEPTIFYERPHLVKGRIYVRQRGTCELVKNLKDLRRNFFTSPFQPEQISHLEYEMENIKKYRYKKTTLDVIYMKKLEEFLYDSESKAKDSTARTNLKKLRGVFGQIEVLIDDIERDSAGNRSPSGVEAASLSGEASQKYSDLAELCENFINLYKGVYRI